MSEVRIMQRIRRNGHWFLIGFLGVFVVTLFFGLTGGFSANPFAPSQRNTSQRAAPAPTVVQDKDVRDVAVLVNGRRISEDEFDRAVLFVQQQFSQQYGQETTSDPTMRLRIY